MNNITWNGNEGEVEGYKARISQDSIGWHAEIEKPNGQIVPSVRGHANAFGAKAWCQHQINSSIEWATKVA